jgi:hypothetical protein
MRCTLATRAEHTSYTPTLQPSNPPHAHTHHLHHAGRDPARGPPNARLPQATLGEEKTPSNATHISTKTRGKAKGKGCKCGVSWDVLGALGVREDGVYTEGGRGCIWLEGGEKGVREGG